jgi:hypothetical protein
LIEAKGEWRYAIAIFILEDSPLPLDSFRGRDLVKFPHSCDVEGIVDSLLQWELCNV